MKIKLLSLLLALLMLLSLVACNEETGNNGGNENGGGAAVVDASTSEHYLPEKLFADVKTEFEKKNATDFPALSYNDAPFAIADAAFAGKKITQISLPVRMTGEADEDGMLVFTLYVLPNNYNALMDAKMVGVTKHTVKINPADYGIEANQRTVCKYITVDLSSFDLQLTNQQTLAIGHKQDTVQIASMNTRATNNQTPKVIRTWREDWMTTGYHHHLFNGKEGKDAGGLQYSRNSLPIDFVFDYGTAEAKKAVVDARKAEEDAYAAKLKAVAEAYAGKYVSLMGDSISSFAGITDNTDYSQALINNRCYYTTTQMNDYTQMYWGRLAEDCDMELCVINGWSSSKVYGGGQDKYDQVDATKDNMLVRSTTLQNNQGQKPDVILLYMGINDVSSKHWSDLYTLLSMPGRTKTDAEIVEEWLVGVHHT